MVFSVVRCCYGRFVRVLFVSVKPSSQPPCCVRGLLSTSHLCVQSFCRLLWLLLLPCCAVSHRTLTGPRRRRRGQWLRAGQQLLYAFGAFVQCYLVLRLTLDGMNGSLVGFFAVLVFATHIESLLSTYDVRGGVRQALNYVIFVLI